MDGFSDVNMYYGRKHSGVGNDMGNILRNSVHDAAIAPVDNGALPRFRIGAVVEAIGFVFQLGIIRAVVFSAPLYILR